jgi:tRNA dimethylallyltransferase
MQVYRDLSIITARPTAEEMARAPHHLLGTVDAAENYSVARWLADASAALRSIEAEGRFPVFVGGTGLYFRALTQGLSDIPPVPEAVRAELRDWAEGRAAEDIHARLAALDPETAATLKPSDPQRNLRALEVFTSTGRSLVSFHAERTGAVLQSDEVLSIFLAPDRDILRARIDARFDGMMAAGALEEVERLAARGLDPALPAMRAHGVPGLIRALRGDLTFDEAIEKGKADTRAYSKRQHTWFRHQAPDFTWVKPEEAEMWVGDAMRLVG